MDNLEFDALKTLVVLDGPGEVFDGFAGECFAKGCFKVGASEEVSLREVGKDECKLD